MKERVSVLMDGELDDKSAAAAIQSLANERDARDAWRSYHLIGDLMRGSAPLSEGFAARSQQNEQQDTSDHRRGSTVCSDTVRT